jgi:formylglycine-generating enzyme required for sulfatase activity
MSSIFLSHSSKNNDQAVQLRDWLEAQGWGRSQIFLDLNDLKVGDRWRDVLNAMGPDCEAVIVCLSDDWIKSPECTREFTQAQERGKPIFPVFVLPVSVPVPRFITDLQIGDINTPSGFDMLRHGLLAARISPDHFQWPPLDEPDRPVYRGLKPLDVEDAGIFFGRDAAIARGLDELRRLRANAAEHILVILGASGAGKSSFLRAGLVARLKRDDENFLVLPIIRPERAAISGPQGLIASLSRALGRPLSPAVGPEELAKTFEDLRRPLLERLHRPGVADASPQTVRAPTIVIAIDQGEELFGADNPEGARFCEILGQAVKLDGNALIVATVRSDSYEPFQNGWMRENQTLFALPAVSAGAFKEIIEGPARLAKPPLDLAPALTQQLLSDLTAADALPLLAFTLERLNSRQAGGGKLTLADYQEKLGGLAGAIASAVEAVLGAPPSAGQLKLARKLFIPALVHVDHAGAKRRIARRSELPAETQALAHAFIAQGLLVSDGKNIEAAHEAILRQWPALAGWISEEREALAALTSLKAAAHEWGARTKQDGPGAERSWLVHRGERLKIASSIVSREDLASGVDAEMLGYISACRKAERRGVWRQVRTVALIATLALLLAGGYAYTRRERAELQGHVDRLVDYEPFAKTDAFFLNANPGDVFQECREGSVDCPPMVVIPNRPVTLAPPDDGARGLDDGAPVEPQPVRGLAVSRTEVTVDQWGVCAASGHCRTFMALGVSPTGHGERPITHVSWNDAHAYAAWLSEMTGARYRLLTSAEWEYAARAQAGADLAPTRFSWGDQAPSCAVDAQNGALHRACGRREPTNVGSYRTNGFGLRDMHGNVSEWTGDCHTPSPEDRANGIVLDLVERPQTEGELVCPTRIVRGGAYYSDAQFLESGHWSFMGPDLRNAGIGFRIARELP